MRKPKIWLSDFEGYGSLGIDWHPGPFGEAVEALNEEGVGFFAANGELLGVEFDEVRVEKDHQFLEFHDYLVEAIVNKGNVTVKLHLKKPARKKAA